MITNFELSSPTENAQTGFLAIPPRVKQVGHWHFRFLRCLDRRQECIAETVALCWMWLRRLADQGRDSGTFVFAMATFAAKAVTSGRRLCGQEKTQDVMSRVCQRRRGFVVGELDERRNAASKSFDEALRDNTQTPVPDQAQFRIDFPIWRSSLDDRRRRIMDRMMEGCSTSELAPRFGVTPGRIAQLRREFFDGYAAFCGTPDSRQGK